MQKLEKWLKPNAWNWCDLQVLERAPSPSPNLSESGQLILSGVHALLNVKSDAWAGKLDVLIVEESQWVWLSFKVCCS